MLGGALALATNATQASDVGSYDITASGLRSRNYEIAYRSGTMDVRPARLTVTPVDARRYEGQPDPDFEARIDGFVLDEGPDVLSGRLRFSSDAGEGSGPGRYRITASGLRSTNYRISYAEGTLTVAPAPGNPEPPVPGDPLPALDNSLDIPERGLPPYTPGDAAFRTTVAEAPRALGSPFRLTYSLGEVAQLVTPGAADTGGFTPAAGGAGGGEPLAAPPVCSGLIGVGAPQPGCARSTATESFWTTAFPEAGQ